ncbi:Putative uncharacterized protein [Taphrina deformans PYCC 5710]|uniref:MIF4G domain-containing protein n=1 Tax=Taphrina deformans (strain PYCC 5710 / ATCC 11124 / CBS 356.35 / IMI 108563 / JCM 9778 / NBRC 8474) TaxID=1097556 RepID=R4XBQ1_TAPDE|nr:Putative uncharacterized protein [Taphrina deformans PYCC 5710]|eukprot:CCG83005.1 Putative uncharacterized protein [Taphrina deformans PYCC 5710]
MSDNDERLKSLQAANAQAWNGPSEHNNSKNLDSSLKKNTAFIKKARLGLNAENQATLLADIKTLSLEKYLSEVVSAIAEGLAKVKSNPDISASTEVVSALHQRFAGQFTSQLAYHLVRALAPPPASYLASLSSEQREKDESSRIGRQRNLLKVSTDLWLVGVFRTVQDALEGSGADTRRRRSDEALPLFCLRELLAADKDFTNLSIATSFVRYYSECFEQGGALLQLSQETTEKMVFIIRRYYDSLAAHLQRQNQHMKREQSRLEDSTVIYGAAPSAREGFLADMQKLQDKQIAAAQVLSEVLKLEPLVLQNETDMTNNEPGIIRGIGAVKKSGDVDDHDFLWEDEDQRRFYENLVDLSQVVPSDMLHEDKPASHISRTGDQLSTDAQNIDITFDDLDADTIETVEDEPETSNTTVGIKVQNLLVRLPELTNRELIDNAAVEFSFLNSKASRNRLIRTLLEVGTARVDLLPYYARLIAILGQYLTSISETVVLSLHRDFRRYTHGKGLNKDISKRTFNVRYLSELIKFRLVPLPIIFHCLRIAVESFTKPDAEIIAVMLEHCGRFLLRSSDTSGRFEAVLTTIMRKAKNTTGVERTLIENAFYYVNPPESSSIPQRERTSYDLYLSKLIYEDLSTKTSERVLKQLKKFDWNDHVILSLLTSTFTKPWKTNFSIIPLMAVLLAGLSKFHPRFVIQVVDTVMEQIRIGMEENIFRENQKRISIMKYLGELFNHKIIESRLVLETVYLTISFGTTDGRPTIGGSPMDPAEDFFRVRLVLVLLNTCGSSFSHGALRNKMDLFLSFFQYYLKTKARMPIDVEYSVVNTLGRIRPGLRLCTTVEEAARELDESLERSNEVSTVPRETQEDHDFGMSSTSSVVEDELSGDDSDAANESRESDSGDEQHFVLLEKKREQDDLDRLAEDELDREFGRLMNESLDLRKQEIKKPLDIALPRRLASAAFHEESPRSEGQSTHLQARDVSDVAVKFTFLSRKSKPRMLDLPSDSPLAINNAAHRIAEEEEKRTIRELTLKYEVAQTQEELEAGPVKHGSGVK